MSLSYAAGLVAVAWADGPLGIDIEDAGPPVDGVDRLEFSRREALFKADAEVHRRRDRRSRRATSGAVAGTEVTWRLAGPAALVR